MEEIEKHKDIIVTSSQVEMEFKKNRQSVILGLISEVRKTIDINLNFPAVLADTEATKIIRESKKNIELQRKELKQQIEKILTEPNDYDPVYKSVQRLFKHKSETNLDCENKQRFTIRRLALKRFTLGYPPRKKSDNSIGDAVNWEWIIKCAESSGKHIILVTRDQDFGAIYGNESYFNDWLSQEFEQRIKGKRKLILTHKLSRAFELVHIPVTKEMIEEEENVIRYSSDNYNLGQLQSSMRSVQETFRSPEFVQNLIQIRKAYDSSEIQEVVESARKAAQEYSSSLEAINRAAEDFARIQEYFKQIDFDSKNK